MGDAIEDVDYYALLGVEPTATLQEIRTAYRKKSLKVHPDRNPDNPQAASLFHDLSVAQNVLIDPTQRASYDSLRLAREAKKARFAALDNKRKAMAEDLERREREFKKSRGDEDREHNRQMSELERLKEEGRKMREAREKAAQSARDQDAELDRQRAEEERKRHAAQSGALELGELDTTLRIKFSQALRPTLTSPESLTTLLSVLLAPSQPDIDSIPIFKLKEVKPPKEGKKPKSSAKDKATGTAMVQLRTLRAAVRIVERYEESKDDKLWEGIEVVWAAGNPPVILGQSAPKPSAEPPRQEPTPPPAGMGSFPSSMGGDSDESRILAQLRAKERERLMEDMRRAEEEGA